MKESVYFIIRMNIQDYEARLTLTLALTQLCSVQLNGSAIKKPIL